MTVFIMARTEAEADEAAFNLGAREWFYPLTPRELGDIKPALVLYVDGWRESKTQGPEIARLLSEWIEKHDVPMDEMQTTRQMLEDGRLTDRAQQALAAERYGKRSPFVSPEEAQSALLRPRRRTLVQRFTAWIKRHLGAKR
jgi:hypothetical protein